MLCPPRNGPCHDRAMPRRSRMVLAGLFLVLSTAAPRNQNLKPADGYVPDESTAVAIGEAVMVPIWGTAAIARRRPIARLSRTACGRLGARYR